MEYPYSSPDIITSVPLTKEEAARHAAAILILCEGCRQDDDESRVVGWWLSHVAFRFSGESTHTPFVARCPEGHEIFDPPLTNLARSALCRMLKSTASTVVKKDVPVVLAELPTHVEVA